MINAKEGYTLQYTIKTIDGLERNYYSDKYRVIQYQHPGDWHIIKRTKCDQDMEMMILPHHQIYEVIVKEVKKDASQ